MAERADSNAVIRRMLVHSALWMAGCGALLFVSAGTLRWPGAWVYLALLCGIGIASGIAIARRDPDLIRERMRPPVQSAQKAWDKALLVVVFALSFALYIAAGLDHRWHWSAMPLWLEMSGAVAVAFGLYVFHIVMRENTYAAAVVRVQAERGHRVVSTGPYAWVRHPMYAGAAFYFIGAGLLLGSWYAVAIACALIALFGLRAVWEEDALRDELPGYGDYAARVRYRLLPGVW